jgi:hypothetical protein
LRKYSSEIFNGDNEYFFSLPEIDLGQRSIQVERVRRCAIPPFEEECFDFHNKILFEDC